MSDWYTDQIEKLIRKAEQRNEPLADFAKGLEAMGDMIAERLDCTLEELRLAEVDWGDTE